MLCRGVASGTKTHRHTERPRETRSPCERAVSVRTSLTPQRSCLAVSGGARPGVSCARHQRSVVGLSRVRHVPVRKTKHIFLTTASLWSIVYLAGNYYRCTLDVGVSDNQPIGPLELARPRSVRAAHVSCGTIRAHALSNFSIGHSPCLLPRYLFLALCRAS
jgi:hypothetical protein